MSAVLAAYLVGTVCYGLSTTFGIRFTGGLTASTAAALGPAVSVLGLRLAETNAVWLVVCPVVALSIMLIRRTPKLEVVRHMILFGGLLTIVRALIGAGLRDPLTIALVGGSFYLVFEFVVQLLVVGAGVLAPLDRKMWLLLEGVLICACGLTTLGVEALEWPAFIAVAFVLMITKREFESFVKSRTAYEQTVRAIEKLKAIDVGGSGVTTTSEAGV